MSVSRRLQIIPCGGILNYDKGKTTDRRHTVRCTVHKTYKQTERCVRAQPLQSWPTLCVPMDSPWLPEERTRDTERGKQSQGYILLGNVLFLKLESGS